MTAGTHAISGLGHTAAAAPRASLAVMVRAARLADIEPILALHSEAFADKFGGAFGPRYAQQGAHALATAWRRQGPIALRGMLVAEHENNVIGTTTLRTWEMGGDDGAAAEIAFHEELGLWGAARSLFALSLLDHRIERGEGFITDVAVAAPFRRGGVARSLLARAEQEARLRGKRFLGLYVSARNEGAHRLYRELGFHQLRVRRSFMAWVIFGQGRWRYMRKELV